MQKRLEELIENAVACTVQPGGICYSNDFAAEDFCQQDCIGYCCK